MSMLTPPGMGGKYRITGDKYPRMRRPRHRRRIALAAVAGVVALGLAGWGTSQLIHVLNGDGEQTSAASRKPTCKASKVQAKALPKPGQIKVNVYNATPRGGLAQSTAEELKKRGFVIGKVGNASAAYDKKVPGAGILVGAPTASDSSLSVLGTQLTGATPKTDTRKTRDVDLILGTAFKTLTVPKVANQALTALSKPATDPGCTAELGSPANSVSATEH
jgi:hypothetical protein